MSHVDPAMGNLGYAREENDHYPTPAWVTKALVDRYLHGRLSPSASIWEPACGEGKMSEVLAQTFPDVASSDIVDYGYPCTTIANFLEDVSPDSWTGAIVTNPPFNIAEEFIVTALKTIDKDDGVVAMLLRNEYDSAKTRVPLFDESSETRFGIPFACKLVLTSRPRWIEGSTGSPRHNYSWFIWDTMHTGPATLRWHVRGGK